MLTKAGFCFWIIGMQLTGLQRFYYLVIFLSLVVLVFYLGYMYGNREWVASNPNNVTINNPNGQTINSITKIQQRQLFGSSNSETIEVFGLVYFVENNNNQTEVVIDLQNVPPKIKQTKGLKEVNIPDQLSVEIAKRVKDSDGKETYSYQNISSNANQKAIITLAPSQNNLRGGKFSGNINSLIFDPKTLANEIERVVLRPLDGSTENIFIDRNSDLPIKVRGNAEAGITGQPAPFFWAKF